MEGEPNQIPKGRIENWYGGFKTVIGQDENNRGKTLGILFGGKFYPLEEGEEFIQKPIKDPKPFIRLENQENVPFDEWVKRKGF